MIRNQKLRRRIKGEYRWVSSLVPLDGRFLGVQVKRRKNDEIKPGIVEQTRKRFNDILIVRYIF